MPNPIRVRCWLTLATALLLAGCGSEPDTSAVTVSGETSEDRFGICRMLTADEVSRVLPGHAGGRVAKDGGSLIEGVDTYQCSYTASNDTDARLLSVIVTVASTEALFAEIEPSGWLYKEEQAISLGDGGWAYHHHADEMKIRVSSGRALIDLELLAPGAAAHKEAMLALTRTVVERVGAK